MGSGPDKAVWFPRSSRRLAAPHCSSAPRPPRPPGHRPSRDPGVPPREVSPGQDQTPARGADPRGWGWEARRPGSLRPKRGGAVPAESAAELAQTTKAIVRVGACPVTECPKLWAGGEPKASPCFPDPPFALLPLRRSAPGLAHPLVSTTL